jgi:hypothetical protein
MVGVKMQTEAAWDRFENSSLFKSWKQDNPGEYETIANYRVSDAQEPTSIKTQFGLGLLHLVNAGKYGDGTYQPG